MSSVPNEVVVGLSVPMDSPAAASVMEYAVRTFGMNTQVEQVGGMVVTMSTIRLRGQHIEYLVAGFGHVLSNSGLQFQNAFLRFQFPGFSVPRYFAFSDKGFVEYDAHSMDKENMRVLV